MSKVKGLILAEGPDGAGKTTLLQRICDKYDGLYIHRTWSKTMDVWQHHLEALLIAQQESHHRLVCIDRLWPSGMIYGRTFRNGGDYGPYNARSLERVFLRMAGVMVLCVTGDIDYLVQTHGARAKTGGEMFDTVETVAWEYMCWAFGGAPDHWPGDLTEQQMAQDGYTKIRNDWVTYDVTKQGAQMDVVIDSILAKLEERQSTQWSFGLDPETPNALGHAAEAEVLFVGERLGDPDGVSKWPFCANKNSPDYLNRALHQIGWNESRGAWTNAWDPANCLPHIYAEKPTLKVVCLGREAERRCKQLRIPVHATVKHPSYARRFHHHGDYHLELAEALR